MITNQIIQTSIDELKAITKVDLIVYDALGAQVAGTLEKIELSNNLLRDFANSPADSQVIGQNHLLKIYDEGELLFLLVATGYSDDVYMVGKIAASQIQNLVSMLLIHTTVAILVLPSTFFITVRRLVMPIQLSILRLMTRRTV